MGRIYTVPFVRVADTVGTDLWELIAATAKALRIHEVVFGQTSDYGDSQAEGLLLEFYRAAGSYNTGSGGTTPTPAPLNSNDQAAGFTAKCNNTVLATAGSGTLTLFRGEAFNVQAGYQFLPVPEDRPLILPAQALIVRLSSGVGTAGPADSLTISGTAVVEED